MRDLTRMLVPDRQPLLLLGIMGGFLLAVVEGPISLVGRLWWLVACGLLLAWQPILSPRRPLSRLQALAVLTATAFIAWRLDWTWLAGFVILVAALVAGKLIVVRDRRLGWFYLLAFAALCALLFLWISPRLFGSELTLGNAVWPSVLVYSAFGIVALALPWQKGGGDGPEFDLLVGLLVLLLLSSVLLATGVMVALERLMLLEALVRSLIGFGAVVFALGWLWNPRLGFSGLAPVVSRYLFRFGFPFEDWLSRLSALYDRDDEPDEFLKAALASLVSLPWVTGGRVVRRNGPGFAGEFGVSGPNRVDLSQGDVELTLFTSYRWTASLVWQANLLFRLVLEFHRARQRERALRQLMYLQAVYETGSRVTHDVKNLLQSMQGLCFALAPQEKSDASSDMDALALVRRQLPQISSRLRTTLDKLVAPGEDDVNPMPVADWWRGVVARHGVPPVNLQEQHDMRSIPSLLFDSVVDNLVSNAMQKRAVTPDLKIDVELKIANGRVTLRVADNGVAVPETVTAALFSGPVPSTSGLGVGLFHCARLAERFGFELQLEDNRDGAVAFLLSGPINEVA